MGFGYFRVFEDRGIEVRGFGFRLSGFWFSGESFGFRVSRFGLGVFEVWVFQCRGFEFGVWRFAFGFRVGGSGCCFWGLGFSVFRVSSAGIRVSGLRFVLVFRVSGSGLRVSRFGVSGFWFSVSRFKVSVLV